MKKNAPTRLSPTPLFAQLDDLSACLGLMKSRPLKLVADQVCPAFNETMWRTPRWTHLRDGEDILSRALFPFPADTFQFSLAGPDSKQDYHRHRTVFEIYASWHPMRLRYNGVRRIRVSAGVLMVPPGIWHKVTLDGPTFVFQTVCGKGTIHGDKEVPA